MIEVLVAFLLLSFGIMGLSGLQINALKNNQSALQRSQASMLAYYLMDAMRANRDAAMYGDYNLGTVSTSGGEHETICSPPSGTALANNDHARWFASIKSALGDVNTTCAAVSCDGDGHCAIAIEWEDTRTGIASQEQQSFFIRSRL
jgi:type IV pilus assembly protein PilV